MRTRQHNTAISQYSAALSLGPKYRQMLLVKRSEACTDVGVWKDALNDTNEVPHFCPVQDHPY